MTEIEQCLYNISKRTGLTQSCTGLKWMRITSIFQGESIVIALKIPKCMNLLSLLWTEKKELLLILLRTFETYSDYIIDGYSGKEAWFWKYHQTHLSFLFSIEDINFFLKNDFFLIWTEAENVFNFLFISFLFFKWYIAMFRKWKMNTVLMQKLTVFKLYKVQYICFIILAKKQSA